MKKRGRPKREQLLVVDNMSELRQFTREHKSEDGVVTIWTYDLDKFTNGPISVESIYPKNYQHYPDYTKYENMWIPIKHRVYYHPKTGKEISHNKAVKLGLAR